MPITHSPDGEKLPFELSGPDNRGLIGVHRPGESLPLTKNFVTAARLCFENGQWQHDTRHSSLFSLKNFELLVDVRRAIEVAMQFFPNGPEGAPVDRDRTLYTQALMKALNRAQWKSIL